MDWKAGGTHISRKYLYFRTAPLLLSAELEERFYTSGWCYLKMQRSLVLREEAHFQTGKWVHNILWKPLEVWVSLVSLQKLPCLHSSHSALVTMCKWHFKADFSKPGSACAFQTLSLTPQLSRICCYFKKLHVPRKKFYGLAQSLIICICFKVSPTVFT